MSSFNIRKTVLSQKVWINLDTRQLDGKITLLDALMTINYLTFSEREAGIDRNN